MTANNGDYLLLDRLSCLGQAGFLTWGVLVLLLALSLAPIICKRFADSVCVMSFMQKSERAMAIYPKHIFVRNFPEKNLSNNPDRVNVSVSNGASPSGRSKNFLSVNQGYLISSIADYFTDRMIFKNMFLAPIANTPLNRSYKTGRVTVVMNHDHPWFAIGLSIVSQGVPVWQGGVGASSIQAAAHDIGPSICDGRIVGSLYKLFCRTPQLSGEMSQCISNKKDAEGKQHQQRIVIDLNKVPQQFEKPKEADERNATRKGGIIFFGGLLVMCLIYFGLIK